MMRKKMIEDKEIKIQDQGLQKENTIQQKQQTKAHIESEKWGEGTRCKVIIRPYNCYRKMKTLMKKSIN